MPEANNQSTPVETSRVESVYVERLFNLGNYENIKYGVRVVVAPGDDPGRVLANLERILADLRADSGVSGYEINGARRILNTPESELDEYEKKKIDQSREFIRRHEEAKERRRKARQALATLNYTVEHKDHKENWEDDGFDVEF